eukprot:CAMPEP_0182425932 /NCGR_PEP_ID=MMETSP1167-20130531/12421_1 /TAXON_ID=2988 /ORGANISM="Mallomonas Sp, Strain CCMP3275" /LENGTH=172 /DNA_ID=CAMNT_0024607025 /DNA_START=873 /DNA_END=1394 /DNA_ORIENTATION=-
MKECLSTIKEFVFAMSFIQNEKQEYRKKFKLSLPTAISQMKYTPVEPVESSSFERLGGNPNEIHRPSQASFSHEQRRLSSINGRRSSIAGGAKRSSTNHGRRSILMISNLDFQDTIDPLTPLEEGDHEFSMSSRPSPSLKVGTPLSPLARAASSRRLDALGDSVKKVVVGLG